MKKEYEDSLLEQQIINKFKEKGLEYFNARIQAMDEVTNQLKIVLKTIESSVLYGHIDKQCLHEMINSLASRRRELHACKMDLDNGFCPGDDMPFFDENGERID